MNLGNACAKLKKMEVLRRVLFLLIALATGCNASACINDSFVSKTLLEEKIEHGSLANAILNPTVEVPDTNALQQRLTELQGNPRTNDVTWWNDLAGAYLRLGKAQMAATLLEPVTNQFAANYGIHANLGTAYHLLGRYAEAEREIARDLEIDPEAHFGVEKYHLALLQYLMRDKYYQIGHTYVDEFSDGFLYSYRFSAYERRLLPDAVENTPLDAGDKKEMDEIINGLKTSTNIFSDLQSLKPYELRLSPPAYRMKWDLGSDPKLEQGVIYMASLNPKEPACWVMLGIVAKHQNNVQLAKVAFEKAVQLNSLQAPILKYRLAYLDRYAARPFGLTNFMIFFMILFGTALVIICILIYRACRKFGRWIRQNNSNLRASSE